MSDLVPAEDIERLVGAKRHRMQHLARAVSAEQTVYVLHSQRCRDSGIDLRDCPYSLALDAGIDPADWHDFEDRPVVVAIIHGLLFPVVPKWLDGHEQCPTCSWPSRETVGLVCQTCGTDYARTVPRDRP